MVEFEVSLNWSLGVYSDHRITQHNMHRIHSYRIHYVETFAKRRESPRIVVMKMFRLVRYYGQKKKKKCIFSPLYLNKEGVWYILHICGESPGSPSRNCQRRLKFRETGFGSPASASIFTSVLKNIYKKPLISKSLCNCFHRLSLFDVNVVPGTYLTSIRVGWSVFLLSVD